MGPHVNTVLIRGGLVADPVHGERVADVRLHGDRIVEVGPDLEIDGAQVVDARGLVVLPGSIDAHSHADARILDDDTQEALLSQGVTTVIVGQDGVSFAPGDGEYGTGYFGPLNGTLPGSGKSVADLLARYEGRTRLGVGYLVPAGTVRHEVMGDRSDRPSPYELDQMTRLVAAGMADGALGLSSGLDYAPGCYADATELAALCRPVAQAGGLYASHMRGYEENAHVGFAELAEISRASGVRAHISHFHARTEVMRELVQRGINAGLDISFDSYPYTRGFSLLELMVLPKDLVPQDRGTGARSLRESAVRGLVRDHHQSHWADDGIDESFWASQIQIASAGHPDWAWTEGWSLHEIAAVSGAPPLDIALDIMADSSLTATGVVEFAPDRSDADLAEQFALAGACVGSDGIYLGGAPHPRAWGAFARMYRIFVVERANFTWSQMATLISARPAERYGLRDRGRVAPGYRADLWLADPGDLRDNASYADPKACASGARHVFVAGREVLNSSGLTSALPGGAAVSGR